MSLQARALHLDATGLKCPILFVTVKQYLKKLSQNQMLTVVANDSSGIKDIKRYLDKYSCQYTLSLKQGDLVEFCIIKD